VTANIWFARWFDPICVFVTNASGEQHVCRAIAWKPIDYTNA